MAKNDKTPVFFLVVVSPFALGGAQYEIGLRVTDADKIAAIMASEMKNHCNKVPL